jgi:hypothetical protein
MFPEPDPGCTTCRGIGYVDETLGGEPFSNSEAPCPDCVAPVPVVRHVFRPACICKWFIRSGRSMRLVNLECTAHNTNDG